MSCWNEGHPTGGRGEGGEKEGGYIVSHSFEMGVYCVYQGTHAVDESVND